MFKKILIGLLILLAVGYLLISYALSNRVLNPESSMERTLEEIPVFWNTTFEEIMSSLPEPEEVTIEGYEGIAIHGQYFNTSDSAPCLFIFAHGWARNWPNMLKYVPMVKECGCDLLLYDHRAHGKSEGTYPTGGIKEAKDLHAVSQWAGEVKGFSSNQIGWFGSSWGAATVLIAGAEGQDVALIIADSPFQNWYSAIFERAIEDYGSGIKSIAPGVMQFVNVRAGIDYREASPMMKAKDVTEPVLLIHSEADPETGSSQSINIAKSLNAQSEFHHTAWGNEHVQDVVNNTEEMKLILMNFLRKNKLDSFLNPVQEKDTIQINVY